MFLLIFIRQKEKVFFVHNLYIYDLQLVSSYLFKSIEIFAYTCNLQKKTLHNIETKAIKYFTSIP